MAGLTKFRETGNGGALKLDAKLDSIKRPDGCLTSIAADASRGHQRLRLSSFVFILTKNEEIDKDWTRVCTAYQLSHNQQML